MTDRNSVIIQLTALVGVFCGYLSSGNPGWLIFCLGIIGWLISTFDLINFNRVIYYATLLCVFIFQSVILISTYLFQMTYLQSNYQYGVFAFVFISYIGTIALLLKPYIKDRLKI